MAVPTSDVAFVQKFQEHVVLSLSLFVLHQDL